MTEAEDEQAAELNRLNTRVEELDQALSNVRATTREPPEQLQSLSTGLDELEGRLDELETEGGEGGGSGG